MLEFIRRFSTLNTVIVLIGLTLIINPNMDFLGKIGRYWVQGSLGVILLILAISIPTKRRENENLKEQVKKLENELAMVKIANKELRK